MGRPQRRSFSQNVFRIRSDFSDLLIDVNDGTGSASPVAGWSFHRDIAISPQSFESTVHSSRFVKLSMAVLLVKVPFSDFILIKGVQFFPQI